MFRLYPYHPACLAKSLMGLLGDVAGMQAYLSPLYARSCSHTCGQQLRIFQ